MSYERYFCQYCSNTQYHTHEAEVKPPDPIITMEGKYQYRNGEPARILCVDRPVESNSNVLSMSKIGCIYTHDKHGICCNGNDPFRDLVPIPEKTLDEQLWEWAKKSYSWMSAVEQGDFPFSPATGSLGQRYRELLAKKEAQ